MTDKVLKWIKEEKLIEKGDTVIAGVSGGADSVCLLRVLLEIRDEIGFSVNAVHVEHGIRGAESRRDAVFVEQLCQKWEVPCEIYAVDVPEYAKANGLGLEEAARERRYACYELETERVRNMLPETAGGSLENGRIRVALAHHADDNAETMLFQMVRGSGIDGLCGMRASRTFTEYSRIIRPLLPVTRTEIETYLAKAGQIYCIDSTNEDVDYSRNRIRHEVLPQLSLINEQAVWHMNQSALLLSQIADYLKAQTVEAAKECCQWEKGYCVILESAYNKYPEIIQTELLHRMLTEAAGSSRDIGMVHMTQLKNLFLRQVGREVTLPYQLIAKRVYEGIIIMSEKERAGEEERNLAGYELTAADRERLTAGEMINVSLPDAEVELEVADFSGKIEQIHKNKYTKWLDYDKIKDGLQFRKRRFGDYLIVDDAGHKKKLKEYFINEKIPQNMRDKIWILAEHSQVVWVIGGRISACYKINKDTKRILRVRIIGGNYCED